MKIFTSLAILFLFFVSSYAESNPIKLINYLVKNTTVHGLDRTTEQGKVYFRSPAGYKYMARAIHVNRDTNWLVLNITPSNFPLQHLSNKTLINKELTWWTGALEDYSLNFNLPSDLKKVVQFIPQKITFSYHQYSDTFYYPLLYQQLLDFSLDHPQYTTLSSVKNTTKGKKALKKYKLLNKKGYLHSYRPEIFILSVGDYIILLDDSNK